MAVSLLVAIAAALAWGTIYEARFGTAAVQRFIYHSWWFQGLLGFLALNLAAAAFGRAPWKKHHIPFLLAHLGIILILVGGVVGSRLGIEGRLMIPEGQSASTLQLPYNVLVVHQPNPGIHREFPTRFETTAWNHRPHLLFTIPTGEGQIDLVVDRYYPNALRHEEISDEGEAENPAIHLTIGERGLWLFARDPDRFGARWGQAHLFFLEPSEAQLHQLLPGKGNPPDEARSPLPSHSLVVVQVPSGKLIAILTRDDRRAEVIDPLRVGPSYVHPTLGSRFEVTAHYPRAKTIEQFSNQDNDVRSPVLHLVAHDGQKGVSSWLALNGATDLPLVKETVRVEYRPAQWELPFSVKLLDFRKIDYPGIQMAAGFESDVELTDPERGLTLKRKISMNNPLKYRGFTLFQSSYLQGPVEVTILSVRKDPGTPFVYTGFILVVLGIVGMFVLRKPEDTPSQEAGP